MSELIGVEFHCHICFSHDSLIRPETLISVCRKRGIDRVVVTDHNTITGALEAQKIDPELVIVGEEILTTRGEILAAFVTEEVRSGLSPQETVRRLHDQGAFISLSHPFDRMRENWTSPDAAEIFKCVDAIEIYNSRCVFPRFNGRAQKYALEHNLPGIAGSDAHTAFELGRAIVYLPPFRNTDELREVIWQAKIQARLSPWWVHIASRYASFRNGQGGCLENTHPLP